MNEFNPALVARVEALFDKAAFIRLLGARLVKCGPGFCEAELDVRPEHMQQDQFVHAGVVATLADHTAGSAAATVAPEDRVVLTAEYKINLLRPALGQRLRARAEILRPGKTLVIAESSVWALQGGHEKLVAKSLVTLALAKLDPRE